MCTLIFAIFVAYYHFHIQDSIKTLIINGCLNNVFKTGTSKIFLSVGNLYKKALNIQCQSKSPNIMSIIVHIIMSKLENSDSGSDV